MNEFWLSCNLRPIFGEEHPAHSMLHRAVAGEISGFITSTSESNFSVRTIATSG